MRSEPWRRSGATAPRCAAPPPHRGSTASRTIRSVSAHRARAIRSVEDLGILRPLDDEKAGETTFEPRQGVVHEDVAARDFELELEDRGAAGGNHRGVRVRLDGGGHRGLAMDAGGDLA